MRAAQLNFLFIFFCLAIGLVDRSAMAQSKEAKLTMIDGSTQSGTLTGIDENGHLSLSNSPRSLLIAEIETIVFAEEFSGALDAGAVMLHLVNGSRLYVRNPLIDNELIKFNSDFGLTELPLQTVAAVVWRSTPTTEAQLGQPSKSNDRIVVDTSEGERVVAGLLESLTSEHLKINYQNETRQINVDRITAILLADVGLPLPKGTEINLELVDRSKFKGVLSKLENNSLSFKLMENLQISIPVSRVKFMGIKSDRQVYLSDLNPVDVRQRSEFGLTRDWQRDRSIQGNRLTLRRDESSLQEFSKGLGVQSFTQLDFANENEFTTLRAVVGIDSETKGRGDCRMVVRGDGIELWSERVKGTDLPRDLQLDISGAKIISLIVLPGEEFDLGDHANWCDARFLK